MPCQVKLNYFWCWNAAEQRNVTKTKYFEHHPILQTSSECPQKDFILKSCYLYTIHQCRSTEKSAIEALSGQEFHFSILK